MPPQIRGAKASLRAFIEAAYGEAPGARNGMRLPAVDITIGKAQGRVRSRVLQGNRSETMPSQDSITVSGGTTLQPDVRSIGIILKYLLGAYSVTGPVSGLYTHTFKVDVIPGSLALEKWFGDGGFGYQYSGCKPNGLTWDIGTGGLQECGVDWVGKDETYMAAQEDASPLLYPVVGLKVPSVALSQGGSALLDATRFGINIANNIEGTRTVGGGGVIQEAPEGTITVTGTCDLVFRSITQYNKAINDTEDSFVVTYPAAAGMSLQWLIDELKYDVASQPVPGPAGLTQPLNFTGYYDDAAAASSIRAILVNDVVTYASIP
jgi:hypothetical protein